MSNVTTSLLAWYKTNGRHTLPWRNTCDPYKILTSELMLQQTQVARVLPKYNAFLNSYPTMRHLAKAKRSDVLRHWQGLGYNNRAVRFHTVAKTVTALPKSREELQKLPGIGPYTAGAIMIFAHNAPSLSVDVNVARVLKRVFWTTTTIPTKEAIDTHALKLIQQSKDPHAWQSALMDFGSAICTARKPQCAHCPLRKQCKSKGVRPEELRTPKQSTFLGSRRWWRGQILKQLLIGAVPEAHLLYRIKAQPTAEEELLYQDALQGMVNEQLVRIKNKTVLLEH